MSHATAMPEAFTVPEPDLTPEDLVERARALLPLIRAKRLEAAELGTYLPEIHEEFQKAGFYRILQPRMYGGYEFGLETFFRVMSEVCRADPGQGWCLTLGVGHTLPLVAHYSPEVVAAAFGETGEFIAPHSAAPRGIGTIVEGGYIVTGRWSYSSGSPYSTHFMGTALVTEEDGTKRPYVMLIPREGYEILDDWGGGTTMALQASGSNTVVVDNTFVPFDHAALYDWHDNPYAEGSFGYASTGNPLYKGNCSVLYHGEVACTQIGAARAALDAFEDILLNKKRTFPPQILRYLHTDGQRNFGEAASMVDSAETILYNVGRSHTLLAEKSKAGGTVTLEDELRLGNQLYTAIRLAWEAGELMFRSVGSSVAMVGEPLQEYFLALQMQRTQAHATSDATALLVARAHFGLDAPTPRSTEVATSKTVMNPVGGHASSN